MMHQSKKQHPAKDDLTARRKVQSEPGTADLFRPPDLAVRDPLACVSVHPPFRSYWGLIALAVFSFACFYLLEGFAHRPWTVPFGMQLFNAAFFLLFFLFWLGVSGRGSAAAVITCLAALLIGYANYSVMILRGNPILPWDLLSLETALSVSGNYQLPLPRHLWLLLPAAVLLCLLAAWSRLHLSGRRIRLLLSLACLALLLTYGGVLQSHRFTRFFYFNETLFTPGFMYRQNGFIPSFLMSLRYLKVAEPTDYSLEQIDGLADDIEDLADELEPLLPDAPSARPNLLVIMNETFSDPAVLSQLITSEDYMPFFRSLSDNTVRGDLYVSVVGGNTATTEFEFLTGDSMAFLPAGSVAYQQFIHDDHPSLPTILKELGYRTIAMHPYASGGWDRDEVYDYFSFDQALFIDDFRHRDKIRQYISDQSVYREIIDLFAAKDKDEPIFCFAVTMQNHGGYEPAADQFTPTVEVINKGDGEGDEQLEIYLSLIRESDRALQGLIDHFAAVDEPTVILFFGDHQPHDKAVATLLAQNSYGLDDLALQQQRYLVPFLIWANYDIEEKSGLATSANFLASLLIETTGLPLSGYHCFLAELAREIPVMTASFFMDREGNRLAYAAAAPHQAEWLKAYEILQFNHLFDPGNRLNALFGEPVPFAH